MCPFFVLAQDQKEPQKTVTGTSLQNQTEPPKTPAEASPQNQAEPQNTFAETSPEDLLRLLWEASAKKDMSKLDELFTVCKERYGELARQQQSVLKGFPPRAETSKYQALNDMGTCLFIKAEALMNTGKKEEAIIQFQEIMDDFSWSQAWDPRGWYWSVAEKAQASINRLTGKEEKQEQEELGKTVRTMPQLFTKGTENIIDYRKYGRFFNIGTAQYKYKINDMKGLIAAIGEGIYPNETDIYINPRYKEVRKEGRLKGNHWDFVNTDDLEAAYFKWVTAPEAPGVKLFFLGNIFEKAGMYYEAIKAYQALVVHYPETVGWTYWQTPWYPAQAAVAKIRHIIRTHPELNLDAEGMKVQILNAYDNNIENDVYITSPGRIFKTTQFEKTKKQIDAEEKISLGNIKKKVGEGKVRLVQYDNGHWQLLVNDQPYIIKGITYAPTKVGQSPDDGSLKNWMEEDTNSNGKVDGPYDSWVDANGNNKKDDNEPIVGDAQLMKEMGANTIRLYNKPGLNINKDLLRDLYANYGIRVIMGDFLGKYAIGSGATWSEGTDYENPQQQQKMLEEVKQMVMAHKDEPYILFWLLGNENNYGVASNADKKPEAYFKFVNQVAQWIKSVDPNHPVAASNGDTLYLDVFAKNAPDVDIFAANAYRGDYGFGSLWEQVAVVSNKPAFISEYGCPAFARHLTLEEGEKAQAEYLSGNWMDIEENTAGNRRGVGNALGGIVFEWTDEWWKNYEPAYHDRKSDAVGPFPGGYYFEEWFGLTGQGDGSQSPFLRQLRKSYFLYKDLWNRPIDSKNIVR